jgi:hypothetical protein
MDQTQVINLRGLLARGARRVLLLEKFLSGSCSSIFGFLSGVVWVIVCCVLILFIIHH